jgi:cytochrome c biogenesis protein CcdA
MWLPKIFYESIPFYYLTLGAGGIGAAFYVDSKYWAEVLAAGGLITLVVGLVLLLRRKGYRSSRSRVDFDRTG